MNTFYCKIHSTVLFQKDSDRYLCSAETGEPRCVYSYCEFCNTVTHSDDDDSPGGCFNCEAYICASCFDHNVPLLCTFCRTNPDSVEASEDSECPT